MPITLKIGAAAAALAALIAVSGCAGTGAALNTENLFRDEAETAADRVSDCEAFVLTSEGDEIYGQLLKPDLSYGEKRPCVIFFHGFAGFTRLDDVGQALCRAGCVVLIVHHRGAWGSRGKYLISNCVRDAVNLVHQVRSAEFCERYHTDADAVFLVGHSMGGNTVLNAAAQTPGVRGIGMLAPCDIGTMALNAPKAEMRTFLIENGLEVLHTDGFEAVYGDLMRHASEYAFPNAVQKLRNNALLLITGTGDVCISNALLDTFFDAATRNAALPFLLHVSCPAGHGLMGSRIGISREIADFIVCAVADEATDEVTDNVTDEVTDAAVRSARRESK